MRNRPTTLAIALVAVLSLFATGCGDDGGGGNAAVSDENRPYVDAMKESMRTSNEEDGDLELSDDQIDCLAPRFVNAIGMDNIEAAGVTPDDIKTSDMDFSGMDLTEEDGNRIYDSFGQCDIDLRELLMVSMADDEEMSEATATCMEGVFTDENLRKFMVSSMVNGDEGMEDDAEMAPIMGQLMGCAFMGMGDAFDEAGAEG